MDHFKKGEINDKKIIETKKAPAALGPYSQGIEVNGTLYVFCISDNVKEQTKQSLESVKAILEKAGYVLKQKYL